MTTNDLVYGLDFGTSNTSIALAARGEGPPRLLPIDPLADPPEVLPTLVYFGQRGAELFSSVGAAAWRDLLVHGVRGEGRFLFELKAVMGLPLDGTRLQGRFVTMPELVATVLRHVKAHADAAAGGPVDRVVCGRPARFSDDPEVDRRAERVLDAALERAGFRERVFALEPVAADAASDLGAPGVDDASAERPPRGPTPEGASGRAASGGPGGARAPTVTLTVDIGGGTLDVSLVRRAPGARPEVLAVAGRPEAGRNVDRRLVYERLLEPFGRGVTLRRGEVPAWVLNKVGAWNELHLLAEDPKLLQTLARLDPTGREPLPQALKRYFRERQGYALLREVEARKIELAAAPAAKVRFAGGVVVLETLDRPALAAAAAPLLAAIDRCVDEVLAAAGLEAGAIDAVERIGGTSRLAAVHEHLVARFGPARVRGQGSLTAVAEGLAVLGRRWFLEGDRSAPVREVA